MAVDVSCRLRGRVQRQSRVGLRMQEEVAGHGGHHEPLAHQHGTAQVDSRDHGGQRRHAGQVARQSGRLERDQLQPGEGEVQMQHGKLASQQQLWGQGPRGQLDKDDKAVRAEQKGARLEEHQVWGRIGRLHLIPFVDACERAYKDDGDQNQGNEEQLVDDHPQDSIPSLGEGRRRAAPQHAADGGTSQWHLLVDEPLDKLLRAPRIAADQLKVHHQRKWKIQETRQEPRSCRVVSCGASRH